MKPLFQIKKFKIISRVNAFFYKLKNNNTKSQAEYLRTWMNLFQVILNSFNILINLSDRI